MKTLLFILISFLALTSFISGLLILSHPDGSSLTLRLDMLKDTPFHNFLVPGLVLTILVGGTNLIAVVYNIKRLPNRYNWAIAGGVMIICFILTQIILIKATSWLQFLYLGIGFLVILIAYQLKGKWAV